MTDLDTAPVDTSEGSPTLPACWRDAARALSGTPFREDVRPWSWLKLNEHEAEKLWATSTTSSPTSTPATASAPYAACWALHGPIVEEPTTLCFAS